MDSLMNFRFLETKYKLYMIMICNMQKVNNTHNHFNLLCISKLNTTAFQEIHNRISGF